MNKKIKIILSVMSMCATLAMLSGCQANDEERIIGQWEWSQNFMSVYEFNADGTGSKTIVMQSENFTWETNNGELILTFEDSSVETRNFSFEGGNLVFSNILGYFTRAD